jgi:hypothetical protein
MSHVVKVADGAYFVPSYSDQTIAFSQLVGVTQSGITSVNPGEGEQFNPFQQDDLSVDELIDEILVERAPAWKELAKH